MITLFIDTSTTNLTVALFKDDVLLSKSSVSSMEHSKYAMTEIETLFKKNNIKPSLVNKIMVLNGPGSFTGVRIGVTIAKIYAWALQINVVPISTLKAYALSNSGYDYYVSLIDARRDYLYAGIYDKKYEIVVNDSYITKVELLEKIKKFDNILIIGDCNIVDYDVIKNDLNVEKIYNYYKNEEGINPHLLNPVYLKETEAEEKMGGRND